MLKDISGCTLTILLGVAIFAAATAHAQTTWYVDDDASLGGDGSSWGTAFKYLQDALGVASNGDGIRVGRGTYRPDQDEAGNVIPGDRMGSFVLVSGVRILGGDDDPDTWEDNDFRLNEGSPCIDAGCNCSVPPDVLDLDGDGDTDEYTPFDLDGEGRFFDDPATEDSGSGLPPIVDMGTYEFGASDLPPCRGDLDGDRDVDWDDLTVLLGNYGALEGANGADGDMDCDGDVQLSDLAVLLSAYGRTCE